jgi:hypothetical protein
MADGNPLHILRAVASVAEKGAHLGSIMVRNLKHAIALLANPRRRNGKATPRNTARNLRIIRMAYALHGGGREIPPRMEDEAVTEIARREKISKDNVRVIVHRYRKRLKDQPLEIADSWLLTGAPRYKKRLVCN